MGKVRKKHVGKDSAVKKEKPRPTKGKAAGIEPDEELDFGGLPKRDLKKNLGCG